MTSEASLQQILASAKTHPMYQSNVIPNGSPLLTLSSFPLLMKSKVYKTIQDLIKSDPEFLKSVYLSPTGGSSGGPPLYFITDSTENRKQRAETGSLMRKFGVVDQNDVVLVLHGGRSMYRALDLVTELIECAGGTALPAGWSTPDEELVSITHQFSPNTITGNPSRLLSFARYIVSSKTNITFKKVVYTSESLPLYKEEYLRDAFHAEVVASIIGSAEAGTWTVAPPTRIGVDTCKKYREFVFDRGMMVVEIVDDEGNVLPAGEEGELVLTSLIRVRHPLVRYRTGDFGSLHPYIRLGDDGKDGRYGCLRFLGRHPVKSFQFRADYVDAVRLEELMGAREWGILEWQVILDSDHKGEAEDFIEFRVVRKPGVLVEDFVGKLRMSLLAFIYGLQEDFGLKVVEYSELEMSRTANKVVRIIDKR